MVVELVLFALIGSATAIGLSNIFESRSIRSSRMGVEIVIFGVIGASTAILLSTAFERQRQRRALHPPPRGRTRNLIRAKLHLRQKDYDRREAVDYNNPDCVDPGCSHPPYALNFKGPQLPSGSPIIAGPLPPLLQPETAPQRQSTHSLQQPPFHPSQPLPTPPHSPHRETAPQPAPQVGQTITISGPPETLRHFLNGVGLGHPIHHGSRPYAFAGNQWPNTARSNLDSPIYSREAPKPQPHRYKKTSIRSRGRAARWTSQDSPAAFNRSDDLQLRRWKRAAGAGAATTDDPSHSRFARYDVKVNVPIYDDETYEKHLTSTDWTKEESDYLIDVYRECNAKWPVIIDHYSYTHSSNRSMEDLKARFYSMSATLLQINTPISSMTAPEYSLYETLHNFNPKQEAARKELADGHLKRRKDEVEEEGVLLSELQRIMLNQATVDNEREDLRHRLDYPHANNGYQYSTSQALTGLWQQMLHADRMRKNQRLRATGHPIYDGFGATPTTARPRDSNVGLPDATNMSGRRGTRDSLPSATPQSALPVDLSKADLLRFGVVQNQDKLPSGVTFASDKLSKPRIAKSTVQTDKIAAILQHIGVPDLIALPTPAIVEQFEQIMAKVHALLDMRKLKDKEEQELRVREAEAGQS